MNVEKIVQIEKVVPLGPNSTIIDHKVQRLTAAGENYGSLMLSVDIKIGTPGGNEEIHAVAKMVPPNEFIQKVFNTQVTFRNEIGFYKNVVPTLQNFQKEQGMTKTIDFFPRYYGSRLNLTGDDKVDSNAILLLENLKAEKYYNVERTKGFDFEEAKAIVTDLAYLHAVPLALKLKKPEVFEREVKKYLSALEPEAQPKFLEKMTNLIGGIQGCKPYLTRAKAVLAKCLEGHLPPREPFATFIHDDCWVNNTMIKREPMVPVKNKIVDFQVCRYGSPAKDLVFFLFSSVQDKVLEERCDDLIKWYHATFVRVLEELKCDVTPFNFESFEKEISYEARNSQFGHIVFMLGVIFAPKGSVKELDEILPDDFLESMNTATDSQKKKLEFVVKEFAKRNWI